MLTTGQIRTIVGIIGNVISFGLFISPLPTFIKIYKKKAVEDFSPVPYLATLLNCMMWVVYGMPFVHPNSLLVVTINGIGFVIEALYIATFLYYAPRNRHRNVYITLVVEGAFVALVVVGMRFGFHTHKMRTTIVGILCVVFGIIMYGSPLSVMKMVIQTKSVKYMPFWLSLVSLLNGICWTIYSLLRFDLYILMPNGAGAFLALCQLILYGIFYGNTPKDEPEVTPTNALTLSSVKVEK